MDVVDVNVLLYAVNPDAPHHRSSHRWLQDSLNSPGALGLTWAALVGFVRLATHPTIWPDPMDVGAALDLVDTWLTAPGSTVLEPSPRHAVTLRGLLEETGSGANLTTDAHLAAIALDHGAGICSFDLDFERFAGLRRTSPGG